MPSTLHTPRPSRRLAARAAHADPARTVGARLRQLRTERGVTLLSLARASRVDAATISRIETGKMTGTLECHMALAAALGAKLSELYVGIDDERLKRAVTVQSAGQRSEVYVHGAGKSSIALLTTDVLKKQLMPLLVTIEPGGGTHKEEARAGTEKFIYVLEGTLEARVGDAVHRLRGGSALYLDGSIPHQLKNAGRSVAKCLVVVTPPVL